MNGACQKAANRGLEQHYSVCLVVNFFINDTNVKVLDKIISKSHISQNVASHEGCRNVIICVCYPRNKAF